MDSRDDFFDVLFGVFDDFVCAHDAHSAMRPHAPGSEPPTTTLNPVSATDQPSGLAHVLSQRPDDELVALLGARPDLASPPPGG